MSQTIKREEIYEKSKLVYREIKKRIVGMEDVVDQLLICLFSGSHAFLIGVPGLAKTLLVKTMAESLDLSFSRIQFTPDLMPSDITGTDVISDNKQTGHREFNFMKGPIFSNVVLADEINRTPPKTQSALLEAMEEFQVTSAGRKFKLPSPFFVFATQNPIEQQGTYPLPAAQLDRFMFNIIVDYPAFEEEADIVYRITAIEHPPVDKIMSLNEIAGAVSYIRDEKVSDSLIQYATNIVRLTRPDETDIKDIKDWIQWGAGPRAIQYIISAAKTRAVLSGRQEPDFSDVKAVLNPVLRHRLILNYYAEAEGVKTQDVISTILNRIEK